EHPVNGGQDDMSRHRTDDMWLVADMKGSGIGGKSVRLGGCPGGNVGPHESVQRAGAIIRDRAEPHPAKRRPSFLSAFNLGGAGDKQLALVAAALTTRRWIVLGAERNVRLVNLHQATERRASGRDGGEAQLHRQQPGGLIRAETKLVL